MQLPFLVSALVYMQHAMNGSGEGCVRTGVLPSGGGRAREGRRMEECD